MKFTQLPIGQRFELDGAVYVKTGPMMAAKEEGGESRFMARYVVVKVVGGEEEMPRKAKHAQPLDGAAVLAAFDQYHAHCRGTLDQLADTVPAEKLAALAEELEQQRRRFLDTIS